MIARDLLDELMHHRAKPAVTITMPCGLPEPGVKPDPIRLGNLTEEAARRLDAMGCDRSRADSVLAPARTMVGDAGFWAGGRAGLALFLAPGYSRMVELDASAEEMVACGERFHITGLLPEVAVVDPLFFVLAVTADRAVLYRADRQGMQEVAADLPQGIASVTAQTDYQLTLHSNPISGKRGGRAGLSGQPGSVPANQILGPSPAEERKGELLHYLDRLATAVRSTLGGSQAPLVLAAQPEVAGNFRKQAEIGSLWPDHLAVNPAALDPSELHRRVWTLLEDRVVTDESRALDQFGDLAGSPRAVAETAELVKAAHWGRMDTLILAAGRHVWGCFDAGADRVETHAEPWAEDDDLVDLAAHDTLRNGGQVRVVDPARLPDGAAAVGILRY